MVERVAAELGRLDVLVTAAAYSDREFFHKADMAGFRKTIDVTLWGAFYCLRAAVNQMLRQGGGGAVVVVSSPHAQVAIPSCMAYNMAKAALDQMARTAAVELFKHRIRVNILYPGWTDTPGERKYFTEEILDRAGRIAAVGPARPAGGGRPRRPLPRRSRFGLHHRHHAHHRRRRLAAVVVETRHGRILTRGRFTSLTPCRAAGLKRLARHVGPASPRCRPRRPLL